MLAISSPSHWVLTWVSLCLSGAAISMETLEGERGGGCFRAGRSTGTPLSSPFCLLTWTLALPQWCLFQQPLPHHHFPEPGPLGSGEKFCEPSLSGSPILAKAHRRCPSTPKAHRGATQTLSKGTARIRTQSLVLPHYSLHPWLPEAPPSLP